MSLLITEEAEKPADLNQRIIFKSKKKEKSSELPEEKCSESKKGPKKKDRSKANNKSNKGVLSFNDEDEDEEG
jgi:hypothetical protein